MRSIAIGLAAFVFACAGAPAPAPQTAKVVPRERPKPELPKPAASMPLASERVELTVKNEFVSMQLGHVQPKLWTDAELVKHLPNAAKAQFQAVERARKAYADARHAQSRASAAYYACDDCPQQASLEQRRKATLGAARRANKSLQKAIADARRSLEKQLRSPSAVAEIGIALARIERRGTETAIRDELGFAVLYGIEGQRLPGLAALETAAKIAGAEQESGQRVRQELIGHAGFVKDAESERRAIDELVATGPREWRAELGLDLALLDAVAGDDAKAAEGFEKALADHVAGSAASRRTLALGVLAARYRALDFERALGAAMRAFEELERPEPAAPEPPPPPKKTPAKPEKPVSAKIARKAALRDAAEFGMLGLLSSVPFGAEMDESAVARLGADCVERLNRDPTTLQGPASARAAILAVLATRALYRNDFDRAKRYAVAAREVGALGVTRQAIDVLRVLALRQDDQTGAKALEQEREKLPWSSFSDSNEPDALGLREELRGSERHGKTPKAGEIPEPLATRNVRSAVRACVEPVRKRLPKATGDEKERRIATIELEANVFEDGHVELRVDADRKADGMALVLDCLKSTGPRVLSHAPSSVSARIALHESVQSYPSGVFGNLWGDSIGEAFGAGGLGLVGTGRGAGGTGEGIGLGSIGRIGHGAGTGSGYGRGTGGPKAKKPAPPKKK